MSKYEEYQKAAAKHRAKADEHNDSVFLLALVCALFADTLGILAPFLGPLVFLLPIISGMITSAINLFFWWYRRDVMQNFDHILIGVLSVLEFMPLVSILPLVTITVIVRWNISGQAANNDKGEAERNEKLAAKERAKLLRARQFAQMMEMEEEG